VSFFFVTLKMMTDMPLSVMTTTTSGRNKVSRLLYINSPSLFLWTVDSGRVMYNIYIYTNVWD
jgi:hypothetical protein